MSWPEARFPHLRVPPGLLELEDLSVDGDRLIFHLRSLLRGEAIGPSFPVMVARCRLAVYAHADRSSSPTYFHVLDRSGELFTFAADTSPAVLFKVLEALCDARGRRPAG